MNVYGKNNTCNQFCLFAIRTSYTIYNDVSNKYIIIIQSITPLLIVVIVKMKMLGQVSARVKVSAETHDISFK